MIIIRKKLAMGMFGVLVGIVIMILAKTSIVVGSAVGSNAADPTLIPMITSIGMIISGVCLIFQDLFGKKKEVFELQLKQELMVIFYFCVLIGYLLVFEFLGFIISTFLLVGILLMMKKCRKWHYYAIMLGLIIGLFFVFVYFMKVKLPWGLPLEYILG